MKCPECGAEMILRKSKYGMFYGCSRFPLCKGTHGAHPNGKPLGFPGNKHLKRLRMLAHKELERHFGKWDGMDKKAKSKMYKWLRENTKSGHIGNMGKAEIIKLFTHLKKEGVI